jgi:hypothetical protein
MAIKKINTDLQIEAGLLDGDGNSGTNNQVLISTGTGVDWVNASTVIGGPYLPLAGGTMTGTNGVVLPDNFKLNLGTSSDLQIYHDGSNSYIKDTGTGNLWIQGSAQVNIGGANGEIGIQYVENANVTLRHNNVAKLTTTSTGIDVTGTAQMDTGITEGIHYVGTAVEHWGDGGTGMTFPANDTISLRTASSDRLYINSSGNVGIGTTSPGAAYKLEVNGLLKANGGYFTNPVTIYDVDATENPRLSLGRGGGESLNFDVVDRDARIYHKQDETTGQHKLSFSVDSDSVDLKIIDFKFRSNNGATVNSTPMTIESSGNVGIGTTSPSEKLHVYKEGSSFIKVDSGATSPYLAGVEFLRSSINGGRIYNDGGAVQVKLESYYGYESANPTRGGFTFKTAPVTSGTLVDALRINALGDVGIGTSTPGYKLDIDLDDVNDRINITTGGAQKAIINGYGNIIAYGSLTSYNNTLGGGGGIFSYKGGTATQTIGHRFQHVNGSFTATSGDQTMMQINPNINQTSTAGYTGIKLNVTETATGSGDKNLLDLQVDGVSKYKVNSDGDITTSGDLTVAGKVTAQEFHTEFVSASIMYESGSTKFGDTSDDNHDFTGSLNLLSGSLSITGPGTEKIRIHNSTNGGGAAIVFNDVAAGDSQDGAITYKHTDSSSQGGGASFHFTGQPDLTLVLGDGTYKGRFVASSQGSDTEVDYGFYDDVNTGMVRTSADNVSLVAGGVRGVGVGTTAVSLKYAGSTKLATSNTGVTVTGDIDADDITIDNWGSVSASLASISDAGGVNGSGASTRVALWSDSDTLTSDAGLTFANSTLNVASTTSDYVAKFSHSTASGFAPGSILLQAGQSTSRGQGLFHYNTEADESWFTGVPYSVTSRKWIVANKPDTTFNPDVAQLSHALLTIDSDTGNTGIGISSPVAKLHVYQNDTEVDTAAGITIEQDGTGDAALSFLLTGTKRWRLGIDNSDSDKFKISTSTDLASENKFTIDTNGNVGIGTTSPDHKLDVDGNIGINQYLYKNGDNDHYIRYTGSKTEIQSPSTIDFRLGDNSQPQGGDFQFASDSGNDFTISYTRTGNAVFKQTFSGQAMHWQNNVLDTVYYANNNGNVGIGTTSPQASFHHKPSSSGLTFTNIEGTLIETGGSSNQYFALQVASAGGGKSFNVTNAGNVGIGTASPATPLHVDLGTVDIKAQLDAIGGFDGMLVEGTNASYNLIGGNGDKYTLGALNDGSFRIYNEGGAGYALTLNNSGKLGIGTTAPQEKLDISAGSIRLDDGLSIKWATDDTKIGRVRITGNEANDYLQFVTDNSEKMRLTNTGLGIGTTSPSEKLSVDGNVQITTGGNTYLKVDHGNVGFIQFTDTSIATPNRFLIQHNYAQDNDFRIARSTGGQDFVIDSSGKVGIGTASPTAKLDIEGDLQVKGVNISNQENLDVDTGTETIATVAIADYDAAFFDYVIKNGTDLRAGTVFAVHNGTSVEFTETSTNDLGNTSRVTLSVDISGADMRLRATATSDDWIIKSLVRTI